MQKLTKEQAIVITGFTGIMACKFEHFHEDVERRLGYPVWTHQFGDEALMAKVREAYTKDFMEMVSE